MATALTSIEASVRVWGMFPHLAQLKFGKQSQISFYGAHLTPRN
jgi:hypothetical protein